MTYTCLNIEAPCGDQLSGPSGKITSPDWPNEYPNFADCFWGIDCSNGENVEITFDSFELEEQSSCQ